MLYAALWRHLDASSSPSAPSPRAKRSSRRSRQRRAPSRRSAAHLRERLSSKAMPRRLLLIIDELDELARAPGVLYNLFDWPLHEDSRLVVIGIANTIDMQRRLPPKVASRLGSRALTFRPYRKGELEGIIASRLATTRIFAPDTLAVVAARVAGLSGDARRALEICRRAAELAMEEPGAQAVELRHVQQAGEGMFASYELLTIERCSLYQQALLVALVLACRLLQGQGEGAGVALQALYDRHRDVCAGMRRAALQPERFREALGALQQMGLVELGSEAGARCTVRPPAGMDLQEILASVVHTPEIASYCESNQFLSILDG